MKLRIQYKSTKRVLEIPEDANIAHLIALVRSTYDVSEFAIKLGFPPRPLNVSNPLLSLKDVHVRSGESLIIEEKTQSDAPRQQATSQTALKPKDPKPAANQTETPMRAPEPRKKEILQGNFSFGAVAANSQSDETLPPEVQVPGQGVLTLRVQPDDNSCLFRAIGYLCMRSIDAMEELRALIATTIQSNPDQYSDAVLGMKRDLYCTKMNRADTWGGEIEIQILSDYFNLQIANIDCKTGHIYRYGEQFDECIYIVYSGIHYDALAMSPTSNAPPDWDQTQFPSSDTTVEKAAKELVDVLRKRNYFTDTANFDLRCIDCGTGLRGERGAQEHAAKTGHVNFGEYKS